MVISPKDAKTREGLYADWFAEIEQRIDNEVKEQPPNSDGRYTVHIRSDRPPEIYQRIEREYGREWEVEITNTDLKGRQMAPQKTVALRPKKIS